MSACVREGCARPAVGCWECARAIALKFFGGISRHPESGTSCQVCEDGQAEFCAEHFITELVRMRADRRAQGTHVGRWPDYPDVMRAFPGPRDIAAQLRNAARHLEDYPGAAAVLEEKAARLDEMG